MNWIYKHEFFLPRYEIDWSIPPEAVPTYLSNFIHRSTNYSLEIYLVLFAKWETIAEHTQKAEELEIPEAQGILP